MPALSLSPLHILRNQLQEKLDHAPAPVYQLPGRWINLNNAPATVFVNPYAAWLHTIDWILAQPATPLTTDGDEHAGNWSHHAIIYNLLLRNALAFDHDNDGKLGIPNQDGFNELGTFIKGIMLLRYIKQLGCNTIHLLPITSVGQDGNKGDLGSPYAIRNPYQIDPNLAETALELDVEAQFSAFVSAAHHLGIRVVLEFVFRTSSKDGDWVKEHPEWFYWIDAGIPDRILGTTTETHYGMPIFTPDELEEIETAVNQQQFDQLYPPNVTHQKMFLPPPKPKNVTMRNGSWQASYSNGKKGRIPGAFADWPPDDPQPPWGDVTYLRLYDHPNYNYIAYNSIRYYSDELAQPANALTPLWERIIQIIPHYQNRFGIDGAMIDMGHALPPTLKQSIVTTARQINPDFAFWDENFHATPSAIADGYNAVIGSLPFLLMAPDELKTFLMSHAFNGTPLPFFGTPESHNTPRAITKSGGEQFVKYAVAIAAFMPALPFIHCGAEFGEQTPVNTGLRFTDEEMAQFPSHKLPLFSAIPYNWTKDVTSLTHWWQKTISLRQQFAQLLIDTHPQTFTYFYSDNPEIWGIIRHTEDWSIKIALIVNQDNQQPQTVTTSLPTGRKQLMDHYTNQLYNVINNEIQFLLQPHQAIWLVL